MTARKHKRFDVIVKNIDNNHFNKYFLISGEFLSLKILTIHLETPMYFTIMVSRIYSIALALQ